MSDQDTKATQETRDKLNAITPERTSAADVSVASDSEGGETQDTGGQQEQAVEAPAE
jgi:hypothetical protein